MTTTTQYPDVPIVKIDVTGPPEKFKPGPPFGPKVEKWRLPLRYHLEDGREVAGSYGIVDTRKACTAYADKLAARDGVPANPTFACFNADGEFWGTSVHYGILGGRR